MSTAARKARKRAGIPFTKPPKVGTPLEERSFVTAEVYRKPGDLMPHGFRRAFVAPRSPARIARFLENGGRP